jgi:uncharacterized FlgJ-related protein
MKRFLVLLVLASTSCAAEQPPEASPEVIVLGSTEAVIEWLEAEDWWGKEQPGEQVLVPRTMITGISERWQKNSSTLPVEQKKEIFYRFMLPLVVHANNMVLERRSQLKAMDAKLANGGRLSASESAELVGVAQVLRVATQNPRTTAQQRATIDQLLYHLDIIPVGLVLGQAAYESGYGTSRFAVEGNALFGQWAYGDNAMVPAQQREELGNYGVATYDWPFDSVRGYYINLNSHPAYEPFRKLRAEYRAKGLRLSSIDLAQGLTSYSERGQEYVDTLQSIIRGNDLELTDGARFRDEPIRFVVGADGDDAAIELRKEIDELRANGELDTIVERMRLE